MAPTMAVKKLLFEEIFPEPQGEFKARVLEIADKLNIDPNWLVWVMWHESGLKPDIGTVGGGLIQFTQEGLSGFPGNLTPANVRQMSAIKQLDLIEDFYLRNPSDRFENATDLALFTYLPAYQRKIKAGQMSKSAPWNPTYVAANSGLDPNQDGQSNYNEYRDVLRSRILRDVPEEFYSSFEYELGVNKKIYLYLGIVLVAIVLLLGITFFWKK